MDDVDQKLLRILRQNAREPYVKLARRLGTSEATVRARIRRLSDDGTIRAFTIRTGGSNIRALVEVQMASNVNTSRITTEISKWRDVEAVYDITGDFDVLVFATAENTDGLNQLIERLRGLADVRSTRSRLILREN